MSIKKILVSLTMLALLCGGILIGSSKPETADTIVSKAEAAQCAVIKVTRQSCMNAGCGYPMYCRPATCEVGPGHYATKSWGTMDGFPPVLTINSVKYMTSLTSSGTYPTCDAYFNNADNWE